MYKVQTFVQEETAELIYDNDKLSEWKEKVTDLNLKGQKKLTKSASPIPFLYMKKSIENIFDTLCPEKRNIDEYDKTPIPLEVLKLIQMSKNEGYFNRIQIWYDDKSPDPICVGSVGIWREGQYYTDSNEKLKEREFKSKEEVIAAGGKHPYFSWEASYLIARWGDEAKSFDQLKEAAIKRYKAEKIAEAKQEILRAERSIQDIDNNIQRIFD